MKLDFANLKNRWRARTLLAISIESGRIAIDVVRSEPGAATQALRATQAARATHAAQATQAPRAAAVRTCTLELGADSLQANPEQAGLQLAALLAAENIRERRCVVCIPAPWALTTSADVPTISGEDLRGYLELRAEREFPIPVADLRLAHCAYALPGGKAQLTLAAVATKRLGALDRMLQSAGCQAVSISLGLDDCLQPAQPAALHFLANGDHVALVIAAGDGVAALRTLPGAVASEAAEFDQAGFAREVRITLGRLPETLREQIHSARFGGARAPAQRLFNYLEKPLLNMGIEARFSEGRSAEGAPDPQGAGAARLAAIKHLAGQALAFEFVEAQTNRWQLMATKFDSRRRRWMIAAGAGVLLAIVGTFLIRSSMESSLEKEWSAMSKPVSELESVQQKIRQFRPWFEPGPQVLEGLESLTSAFPEQGDVWAKSVQFGADTSKVSCTGFARNQAALMSFMERLRKRPDVTALQLQQVRGDNPVQFALTYKWELHNAK